MQLSFFRVFALVVVLSGCQSPREQDSSSAGEAGGPRGAALVASSSSRKESTAQRAPEFTPTLSESSTLHDYHQFAMAHHPGLEAAYQSFRAAAERAEEAGGLPDPRLSFGLFLEEVETAAGSQKGRVGVSQTFPWFGKRGGEADAAQREANAAWHRYEARKFTVFEDVTRALYELHYLRRAIDITGENLELLKQFEQVARARFRVATADHPDVIRIQVELGSLEDRWIQLRQLRGPTVERLNAALSRPTHGDLPWPASLPQRRFEGTYEESWSLAQVHNPELLARQEEVERERELTTVAEKRRMPDFTLGLDYLFVENNPPNRSFSDRGDDPILLNLSFNLPIFRQRNSARERQAEARQFAAANARVQEGQHLAAELRQVHFEHRDAERRVVLYRDTLIPKATESMGASLAGFRAGDSDFLDLLDTERTLLEFQLALERALADRAISLARLERLVGIPLETVEAELPKSAEGES